MQIIAEVGLAAVFGCLAIAAHAKNLKKINSFERAVTYISK